MNLDLTDEQKATQRLARDFAQTEVKPVAEELDKEKRFPSEIVAKLDGLGPMGVPYPEEYGGGGADTLSYALVIEELARFPMDAGATSEPGRTVASRPRQALRLPAIRFCYRTHCSRWAAGGVVSRA